MFVRCCAESRHVWLLGPRGRRSGQVTNRLFVVVYAMKRTSEPWGGAGMKEKKRVGEEEVTISRHVT